MNTDQVPLIIISGPRGAGKGTIIHALVRELELQWIPTHTTRATRLDDADLSHHIFDTETAFERSKERQEFVLATKLGNIEYGTAKSDIDEVVRHHKPAILETTVPESIAIRTLYPHALLFYIHTSEHVCRDRLKQGKIHPDELKTCFVTIDEDLKAARSSFDYMIEGVDGHPEEAIEAIEEILFEHYPNLTEKAV